MQLGHYLAYFPNLAIEAPAQELATTKEMVD